MPAHLVEVAEHHDMHVLSKCTCMSCPNAHAGLHLPASILYDMVRRNAALYTLCFIWSPWAHLAEAADPYASLYQT